MAEDVQKISSERLCQFTGLTDRRHRQLADEGFFPPPIKGQYQLTPTIRGLFRYYREQQSNRTNTYAKLREEKLKKECDLLGVEYNRAKERLVDVYEFMKLYSPIYTDMARIIRSSNMPEPDKTELFDRLRDAHEIHEDTGKNDDQEPG